MFPKEKHITNLNVFVHLMRFSCVIFHLFSHFVQVLSYVTHCSGHNIYAFGSILEFLVKSPNGLILLVNHPNKSTTVNIPFWRTMVNFWNVNLQPIVCLKVQWLHFSIYKRSPLKFLFLQERKYFSDGKYDGVGPCTYQTFCFQIYQEMIHEIPE